MKWTEFIGTMSIILWMLEKCVSKKVSDWQWPVEGVLAKRCGSQSLCQTLQNHDHPWPIDNSGESWWVIRGDGHFPNLALGARTSRPRMRLRPCCERERRCSRNVLSCVYHVLSRLSSWIKLHTWWSGLYIDLVINYFFAPLSATRRLLIYSSINVNVECSLGPSNCFTLLFGVPFTNHHQRAIEMILCQDVHAEEQVHQTLAFLVPSRILCKFAASPQPSHAWERTRPRNERALIRWW